MRNLYILFILLFSGIIHAQNLRINEIPVLDSMLGHCYVLCNEDKDNSSETYEYLRIVEMDIDERIDTIAVGDIYTVKNLLIKSYDECECYISNPNFRQICFVELPLIADTLAVFGDSIIIKSKAYTQKSLEHIVSDSPFKVDDDSLIIRILNTPFLKVMSRGTNCFPNKVIELQKALREKGYDVPVDNILGETTKVALTDFVDKRGYPRELSWEVLEALFGPCRHCPCKN